MGTLPGVLLHQGQDEPVNADDDELCLLEGAPGELYPTVRDLKRWCDAMFACPLVAPHTLQLMFTPHGQVGTSLQYGYGWFLAPRFRAHGGGTHSFRAHIRQYPAQKVSIILLFNAEHPDPETVLNAVEPLLVG